MEDNGVANGQEFVEPTDHIGNTFQYICRVGDVNELLEAVESLRWTDVLHQYDFCGRQITHAVAECDQANAKSKIEILWTMGADINARELILGNTLLHIAVMTRNYLLAEWICQTPGLDVGAVNYLQDTAYHTASRIGDLNMMEILRTNGAVCDDPSDESAATSEILDLNLRLVSEMFKPKTLITGLMNDEGENLLHYLCRSGDVSELLALHDAINDENRHTLVEYNRKRQQCVHIIALQQEDAIEKMKLLMLWGADLNTKELRGGDTPLHIAVRVKNYTLVEWLCQQSNINKEALNNDLMTPYHIAFVTKDDRMMNLLKQNGAQCRVPQQSEGTSDEEDDEPRYKNPKLSVTETRGLLE